MPLSLEIPVLYWVEGTMMSSCHPFLMLRSTLTKVQHTMKALPKELKVVWDVLPEDETPQVARVVELVARLEDRLRAGEKVTNQNGLSIKGDQSNRSDLLFDHRNTPS